MLSIKKIHQINRLFCTHSSPFAPSKLRPAPATSVMSNDRMALSSSSSSEQLVEKISPFLVGEGSVSAKVETTDGQLNFDCISSIFQSKSTWELIRAYGVFTMCKIGPIVRHSGFLIDKSYAVFGKKLTNEVLKKTFFGHFCAGEDVVSIKPKLEQMASEGIGSILDYAAEADVAKSNERDLNGVPQTQVSARTYDYEGEAVCDANAQIALQGIRDAASSSGVGSKGFSAVKCTAMGKPELLQNMSSIIVDAQLLFHALDKPNLSRAKRSYLERLIDYPTFRAGFWNAGIDLPDEETRALFEQMDQQKDGMVDYIDWVSHVSPLDLTMGPLTQFLEATQLEPHEIQQLRNMIGRLEMLAKEASDRGVKLMIDAEQSYMQPAIDHLVLNLQRKYNKKDAVIFNTFQCYLKDSSDRVMMDLERARREGFHFAAKLVRGAYMVQERKRAKEYGYLDPIHNSLEETHQNYNNMVELLLANNSISEFMVASHNEDSVRLTTELMQKRGIPKEGGGVYFGQLLGMCDHVSYSLGLADYQVFKYVPYGPIEEVLPYLIRRAEENSDIMSGVSKETTLLSKELFRRVGIQ